MSDDTTDSRDSLALIPSRVHLTVIEGGAATTRPREKIVASRITSFAPKAKPTPKRRVRKPGCHARGLEAQMPVTVAQAPDAARDLRGVVGVLTITYRGGRPYTVQLDPNDDTVDNVRIPVYGFEDTSTGFTVLGDNGRWAFEAL